MPNITFTGGTPTQQTAITTAHSALATAAASAQTAASTGASNFVSWFGPATTSAMQQVSGVYGSVITNLQNDAFTYDLTSGIPEEFVPNVYVLFGTLSGTNVTATTWDLFWPNYYLTNSAGTGDLALSILHEICLSFVTGMMDYAYVSDPITAANLTLASPAAALTSPFNYMSYLSQWLTAFTFSARRRRTAEWLGLRSSTSFV